MEERIALRIARWRNLSSLEKNLDVHFEKELNPATVFRDRKRPTLDRLYCRYSYLLGHQTISECDETWQAVYLHYNKTTCQLSSHSENIFRPLIKYYFGHATGACKCGWAQNGQRRELEEPGRMQVLKHDDAMHMMTW